VSLSFRLLSTLLPMLLVQIFMHATGPLAFFYIFMAAGCFIPLLPLAYRRPTGVAFFSLGACLGLALIVIQPLSGFLVWFDLVSQGSMRGPVSVVFMYLGGFLSLVAVYGAGPGRWLKSLVQLLLVNFLLAFIVFQHLWLLAAVAAMVPVIVALALSIRPVPLQRWRGLVNLAGLGLLAALLAFATSPGQVPEGMFLIDEYLSVFLRNGVIRWLPDFPVLYGFSGYGHGFSGEKLGRRPLLTERALFAVAGQAGSTHYLRAEAYDTFTDSEWVLSSGHPDRQKSGSLPATMDGRNLLRLRLLMDYYPLLPQILGATTVMPARSGEGLLADGSPATGLSLVRPLLHGEQLVVVEGVTAPEPDDKPELYLTVPDYIPSVALDLAASLRGLDDAELPDALAGLLDDGFTYSLDVVDRPLKESGPRVGADPGIGDPPGNGDFLQLFLAESRTGYCVHFASAAVLLARLAGIPARYVTGFMVSLPQLQDDTLEAGSGGLIQAEITGLNSHAWAELWLPSMGWTTFEATPPLRREPAGTPGYRAPLASLDDFTLRQLATITGGRIDLRGPGNGTAVTPAGIARGLLVLVLIMVSGLGLLRFARRSGWNPARLSSYRWGRGEVWLTGSPAMVIFRKKTRRLVQLAAGFGVLEPGHRGWLAWEEAIAGLLASHGVDPDAPDSLEESVWHAPGQPRDSTRIELKVFREVFFGCRQPDSQDFICVDRLARQLRSLSKKRHT
jgi:hypothetical protein